MKSIIREQILAARDANETNTFDQNKVANIAMREGFYNLVIFLEAYESFHSRFILNGKTNNENRRKTDEK